MPTSISQVELCCTQSRRTRSVSVRPDSGKSRFHSTPIIPSAFNLVSLTDSWLWVGQVNRVALDAHIRWKVSLYRKRSEPARECHHGRLEITPTRYPGLSPRLHSAHIYFLVTDVEIVK